MQYTEGIEIVIAGILFIWFAWRMMIRITVPVSQIEFTELKTERTEGYIRLTDAKKLKSSKTHPLYAGYNDFYVTVQNGKVKYHSRYVLDTITPIIRDSEDILFFRIQVRMAGGKVRKFTQTNLSQPNVTLQWRTVEE